jgi:antitoxin (DNA-binding transcriptional repressor) of toxin-antitoxin stability system
MKAGRTRKNYTGVEMARKNLPALLERASRGLPSVITKHGKVYAAIVPPHYLEHGRRRPDIRNLRGSGRGLWGKSIARTIARIRDEWR